MKKIFLLLTTMILLSSCGAVSNKMESNIVVKEGEIKTKVGEEYLLSTEEGIVNITSNKVNLDSYLKKSVKVEGMFSGSTLYVDKIENN
ncbi:MAG TPA: hypothetical protein PK370_02405 [Candidatus Woesebacteria bacterium]|nr:hypothetical protein [Candidatus Woesebacteria bacterium]HPJ17335.1 hypothetical protein [Candidatus Woesebacteria bacterium]